MNDTLSLKERIAQLEQQVFNLQIQIKNINNETTEKVKIPVSVVGGPDERSTIKPIDIKTGLGKILGSSMIWHTGELSNPPINDEAPNPENINGAKGYNKHTHSRFSGGALIKNELEIVEFDATDWAQITNPHSQQYWQITPKYAKELNTKTPAEQIDKIGSLDLTFNPDTKKWGVATYEIDIKKCYFVERDKDGNIVIDSKGQQKKSFLFNDNGLKNSIIWDELGNCFRLIAVYADGVE
jgi:hypothetical protein